MNKENKNNSLIIINENNIFYKIKKFFIGLFNKRKTAYKHIIQESVVHDNKIQPIKSDKNTFLESIKEIENEETKILKLQQQYENGLINANELSKDQINVLKKLYNKQINELTISNQKRIEKISQNRNVTEFLNTIKNSVSEELQLKILQKKYEDGTLNVEQLSKNQIISLQNLYKQQIDQLSKSNKIRKDKLLQYRKKMQSA